MTTLMDEVVVYGGSGGPLKNGIPVRNAVKDGDLGYATNGDRLLMARDLTDQQWHRGSFARVTKLNGDLLFSSESGENWMERQGHLRLVVYDVPGPIPTPEPVPSGVSDAQFGAAVRTVILFVKQVLK